MLNRFLAALVLFAVLVTTTAARAEDRAPCPPKTTGIVLTTVGSSLIVSAPLAIFAGLAYVSANPYSSAVMGPVTLGALGGGAVGIGLLVPGIVMLAKRSPMPQTRQPAWADNRPTQTGLRALTLPILRGTF